MHRNLELDFVGRENEIEQILAFYQSALTADNASVLWIEGEAGIGKTSLLKQFIRHINHQKPVLCHIRLYPDTPSTISELLDHNLDTAPYLQNLLRQQRFPSIAAKIRHLARLRPTLLILEDIHLLSENASQDLFNLFQVLSEEPVCIICVSRPGEHPATLRLLPYANMRIELGPLQDSDVKSLLQSFPAISISPKLVETLQTATNGIPLVLRSVLTAIPQDSSSNLPINSDLIINQLIEHSAKTSVQSLTKGLTASLSEDEYYQACMLATLGEVFSEEAADALIVQPRTTLDALAQKGIITQVREAILPIIGTDSQKLPWRFAHTLLRNELASNGSATEEAMLKLLESHLPLYSTAVLSTLASREIQNEDHLLRTHSYLDILLLQIRLSYQFTLLIDLSSIAIHFVQTNHDLLTKTKEINAELELIKFTYSHTDPLNIKLSHLIDLVNTYLEKTANPTSLTVAEHRLMALPAGLYNDLFLPDRPESLTTLACLKEASELTTQFPDLPHSPYFVAFLLGIAVTSRKPMSIDAHRIFRDYLKMVFKIHEQGDSSNQHFVHHLIATVLSLFVTEDEAQDQILLAEEVLAKYQIHELPERFTLYYIDLLVSCGRMHRAKEILNIVRSTATARIKSLAYLEFNYARHEVIINAALGAPPLYISEQLNRFAKWSMNADPEHTASYYDESSLKSLVTASHIVGDRSWRESIIEDHISVIQNEQKQRNLQHLCALLDGNVSHLKESIQSEPVTGWLFRLIDHGTKENVNIHHLSKAASDILELESAHRNDVLGVRYAITIIESIFAQLQQPVPPSIRRMIENALRRVLRWCVKGDMAGFMKPFVHQSKNYFSDEEQHYWNQALLNAEKTVAERYQWQVGSKSNTGSSRLHISMLGQIAISAPNQQPKRVQGAKARAILGLMVANELSSRHLSYKGFREIIFGTSPEANSSTDNIRAAVARLRSLLGKDNIITDGKSAPSINLKHVDVDLIRISRSLDKCDEAIRSRYPRKARQHIMDVLRDDVPGPAYPALYDDFFESARLDFELRIRNSILTVSDFLLKEGDIDSAIETLEEGLERVPGDEELLTQLADILVKAGRHADAISVRNSWT